MMNVDLIECTVAIILYTKGSGTKQLVVFDQFHIPDGMDLFSSLDDLIGPVRINVFY